MNLPGGGLLGRALDRIEEATGHTVVESGRVELLEAVYEDYRVLNRQLEDIGWSIMDYVGGLPQEMASPARRRIVQRARYVWMNDPQAGAAVELMNDFVFGRGVPKPRCKDPKVQEVVDEAWDDPDNQEVLTTLEAQLAMGTDLALQSNVFVLMFDDGSDGKVKLSILRHDDVTNAIPDPDKRHRVLYYVCGLLRKQVWNFELNYFVPAKDKNGQVMPLQPFYYKHWRNVELAEAEQNRETPFEAAPTDRTGAGLVYHVRINRYSEQIFGVPRFQRTLRWYCHDEETETLTSDGWMKLPELELRAESGSMPLVAAYDTATDRMVFQEPTHLHVYDYEGEMVRFRSATGFDALVTPNHRMLVRHSEDAPWGFVEAGTVTQSARQMWRTPAAAPLEGGHEITEIVLAGTEDEVEVERLAFARAAAVAAEGGVPEGTLQGYRDEFRAPMDAWLTFLGWWLSEGYAGAYVCQSADSVHLPEIKAACAALGIPGREGTHAGGRMWHWKPTYLHGQIAEWLADNCGVGAREKRVPEFVFQLSARQQGLVFAAMMAGDGTDGWRERGRGTYSTASAPLAEGAQRLAMSMGWRARMVEVVIRGRVHYRVDVAARAERRLPAPSRESYSGRVYCLTLPSGTMITRRNGCVVYSGQSAYNEFVKTRIDRAAAAAAIIMKRKIKGSPSQLARDASKLISRRGVLGSSAEFGGLGSSMMGPRPASIIEENESVDHEPMNLDSGSSNALEDAQMIRAPISAAERFTQAYFGDASSSSLATATSLELPILKAVEGRQEVFEGVFRWFIDRVIERAIEAGKLPSQLTPEEIADAEKTERAAKPPDMSSPFPDGSLQQAVAEAVEIEEAAGRTPVEAHRLFSNKGNEIVVLVSRGEDGRTMFRLVEAKAEEPVADDVTGDEEDQERDLGYEFSLPSPLRRMMTDLITACTGLATTFDPNNTNTELSRVLLTVALGQGLEIEDPAAVVEQIFPPGYQDPAIALAQQQAQQAQPPPGSSDAFPTGPDGNAYSAPMNAANPEDAYPWMQQSLVWRPETREFLAEGFDDQREPARRSAEGKRDAAAELFRTEVTQDALRRLDDVHLLPTATNGNGDHPEET